jgi:hypothetical protein
LSVSSRGSGRSNDSNIREKEADVKLFKELTDIEEQETELKWASLRRQKELAQRRAELELRRIQSEHLQFSSDDEMSPPNTFMFSDLSRSPEKNEEWVNPSP